MDHFEACHLPNEKLVIFVCSTTGQGEEPDNMKQFWKFLLRKSLPSNLLAETHIAVLGLGDSSYLRYNFVAKRLYKRLLQLGARSLLELGLANDQHDLGVNAVATSWISSLWQALEKEFPPSASLPPVHLSHVLQPRYAVHLLGAVPPDLEDDSLTSVSSIEPATPVLRNIRTTSTKHFQPGDVLQVQPCNLEENVQFFIKLFRMSSSAVINVVPAKGAYALPLPLTWEHTFPCSLEYCARHLLDLQAPPQRYALQVLAHFTASNLEKERLFEFSTPEGQEDFVDYCMRPRRTILEMLREFPVSTSTLPLAYIFDLFKPLRPRLFSIASAHELLVAVVKYKSRMNTPRLGLCSNWIARLKPGDNVPCIVRPGSFKFPSSDDIPLIMVGPGTGCAPFRSLVQQRYALGSKGRLILFLGFRNKEGDFHCQAEWQSYVEQGFIQLFVAFSRDQAQKVLHWTGPVLPMDHFEACHLPNEKLVIFVCSTTGQGEEPDNMKQFWKFLLRKSLPSNLLAETHIAVLGLGDSSYLRYNFVAKRLYKRLLQLGARSLLELGLANDQHDLGVNAVATSWISSLWQALEKEFPPSASLPPVHLSHVLQPRYAVHLLGAVPPDLEDDSLTSVSSIEPATPVLRNIRTTSTKHFQPGDVLQVQPCNLEENVQFFIKLFRMSSSAVINVVPAKGAYALPLPLTWEHTFPCSLEYCARHLLDLQAPPQRYALQVLAHFTASNLEKERLFEFSTPEGQEDFVDYCMRPRRTILEMLREFPVSTSTLPLAYIFDLFKPLRPRLFSIASAHELLVAVVKYKSRMNTPRLGLCSNWIARLKPGDNVPCIVRPGSFKFPSSDDIPLIMVGPGTGCAPFRSLVQQRYALGSKGRLILFLGFRNKEGDFHCQAEWQSYVEQGFIQLFVAFSRDQAQKGQACLFVAGNAKNMPTSVREAVVQIVAENKACSQQDAESYVKKLEVSGRYQSETWS
ncbi:hypothetical protein B566_EDAN007042 [Ephemera danica]|nr:hypothetical protein B566_EDAN007042 [Ephemera danica]